MSGATLAVLIVPMGATVSPSSVSGGPSGGPGSPSITGIATVSVTNGVTPLIYAWEIVANDGLLTITSPTADNTTFSAASADAPVSATCRCLVTDARGLTVYSGNVTVELTA